MRDAAESYLNAGLCVLPARRSEKRPAVGSWKRYQQRLPTADELSSWLSNSHDAICILCGAVSGNLEIIDFDAGGERFSAWTERIPPSLRERLVVETTPSGGRHVIYRCEVEICGNLKLAQRRAGDGGGEKVVTLIETRGEGGLFLCAPTPGYAITRGDLSELSVLTLEERDALLHAAWELNEYVPQVVNGPTKPVSPGAAPRTIGNGRPSADRPGDDFNQRGDPRKVLEQHGWVCVRGGENEHWRRPGKDAGWSATLKDGVFYVFSSNATPFEPNRAYSPFSVYALLNHGGDFERAARSLRDAGFGGDGVNDAIPRVDISGILATSKVPGNDGPSADAAPNRPDPGPIPEHLFRVPGFVSQVMDFTLANAPYPNVGLAFCGAMALQSYLCGRRVCDPGDLRPNIYLLALASSGTGKDFPRKVNARVLFEIGHVASLGDKFASGEGIQDALARTSSMLFQNDEMDGVLRQINLDRENKRESIPNILLTLYTSVNDVYPIRVKAGQKEAAHIDQPHLTLFGTATPQYFYESLSQRMLTNGFFARLIIVDIGKRGEGQTPGSARKLPDGILQAARWWAEFQPGTRRANLLDVHPEPRVIPWSPQAQEALLALRRQAEREYDRADESQDETGRTAWSRTCENAKKLALLYACSENHENPIIDLPAVEWSSAFAMHQTRRQLYLASTYVAVSDFDSLCKKAIRYLASCRDQGNTKDYPVPDWKLRRHMGQNPTIYDSITEALVKQEQMLFDTVPSKTKPRSGWVLR